MKKILVIPVILGLGLLLVQARENAPEKSIPASDEVKEILTTSCNDCHSDASKGDKAKNALNFDRWDSYSNSKKVSKLADIAKLVREDKMPPEKYLKHNPSATLDAGQKKLVEEWAEQEAEKILGGSQ